MDEMELELLDDDRVESMSDNRMMGQYKIVSKLLYDYNDYGQPLDKNLLQ